MTNDQIRQRVNAHFSHQRNVENTRKEAVLENLINSRNNTGKDDSKHPKEPDKNLNVVSSQEQKTPTSSVRSAGSLK